ncbi:MAG: 2'-deoxycytidine 5'-triphosphate deaminase [Alphaproteobacteria bacterium]
MNGSLTYLDYLNLFNNKEIQSPFLNDSQIQPASLDLTLSNECYEIEYSFLCPRTKVRNKLKDLIIKKINLDKQYLFEINKTYIVKLNENLNLKNNIFGHCNPKSSTGRLDIFCRTIVDYADEYEKIPKNYKGEIFLEVTSRSFNILLKSGDKLNQLRLIYNKHLYCLDSELEELQDKEKIIFEKNSNIKIDNGLKISVNLKESKDPVAYCAKLDTPKIDFNKINHHIINDFWQPIFGDSKSIIIEKHRFYILRSKEKIKIPPFLAGEMIPYDTGIGDFRAHYAGFFDPGFGDPNGSYAVLEVKTNELPFLLEDKQTIARIKYEKLNKKSNIVYGSKINSNYQNQGLKLSKHFK